MTSFVLFSFVSFLVLIEVAFSLVFSIDGFCCAHFRFFRFILFKLLLYFSYFVAFCQGGCYVSEIIIKFEEMSPK